MKISDVSKIALFRHFQKKEAKAFLPSSYCASYNKVQDNALSKYLLSLDKK